MYRGEVCVREPVHYSLDTGEGVSVFDGGWGLGGAANGLYLAVLAADATVGDQVGAAVF